MKELWLVRHGESAWNVTGQYTGRADVALTARGEEQSAALGRALAGRKFDRVLVSPLKRARETCRLAGYADAAEVCPDLIERGYGEFEGLLRADILSRVPDWSIWHSRPPNGESIEEVADRARRVLALASDAESAILFAHGQLLRILTACALGLTPEKGRLFPMVPASCGVLGREDGVVVVRRWGITPR